MLKQLLGALLTSAMTVIVAGVAHVGSIVPTAAGSFDKAKSENWGVSVRNTIGSPVAELRDGMSSRLTPGGVLTEPPYGTGSLGIAVGNYPGAPAGTGEVKQEKVDFGNEVDFFGEPIGGLTEVGFHVFQTGENVTRYGGPTNMPNIRFEIDPAGPETYTTMVWVPDPVPASAINKWSDYLDATQTGGWYFTSGSLAVGTCNLSAPCPFGVAKAKAGSATVYSVLVGKGRDNMWIGAIDGLRLNNKIYDFERDGVQRRNAGAD